MEQEPLVAQATPPVTVAELDNLCKQIADQKRVIEEAEAVVTQENKKLAALEKQAESHLRELDRTNYKSDFGMIYVTEKWTWSLPQTPEAKAEFFDYLKNKGLFDQYATINHNSYNSYVKAEFEAAKEDGRGMDFSLPGVPEPTLYRKLIHKKG